MSTDDAPIDTTPIVDAPIDAGPCRGSSECTQAGRSVCDVANDGGTCVLCTPVQDEACTGLAPRCENNTCVACATDQDCDGGVCLSTGACVAANTVLHAASLGGSTTPDCGTTAAPCTLTAALGFVTVIRNVIKLDDDGHYTPNTANFVVSRDVTIDARRATLHSVVPGPLLTISTGKTAIIHGGTFTSARAPDGSAIACNTDATLVLDGSLIDNNDGSAVNADACKLTITNTTISGSNQTEGTAAIFADNTNITLTHSILKENTRSALNLDDGIFIIIGNVFLKNGDPANQNPVIHLSTSSDPDDRLDFNTIAFNTAANGLVAGINCQGGNTVIASNNIIWGNGADGTDQQSGSCKYAYSDIGPVPVLPSSANDGGNNISMDPMLTSSTNPHLLSGSPAIGKANPAVDLTGLAAKDIDGEARAAPADMGADYVLPRP